MTYKTLGERYAELQAERDRTWRPEQLARNAGQRRVLAERYDPAGYPQPGDTVAPFTIIDQDGKALTRDALTANGPAVLVFFRFAGCPACNLALPYYNETLLPHLQAAGIPLVAVSAQNPVDRGIIDRHGLNFPVAADPDYALGRALGITFLPEEQPKVTPGDSWIGATLGTNSYERPAGRAHPRSRRQGALLRSEPRLDGPHGKRRDPGAAFRSECQRGGGLNRPIKGFLQPSPPAQRGRGFR